MPEERKSPKIWNAERILYAYLFDSDELGYLPNVDSLNKSSYKIGHQRFYAALRAYEKDPEWFYKSDMACYRNSGIDSRMELYKYLLSKTRSEEKMNEFRELVKQIIRKDIKYDYLAEHIDNSNFLKSEVEVVIAFTKLMEYRKKLYAIDMIWSGMMECGWSTGIIYQATRDITREYIYPMSQIIDRMLILLMGDDYDKTFNAEELIQYGYPNVTDEEFEQMDREEWDS